jgi:hypothetical protein
MKTFQGFYVLCLLNDTYCDEHLTDTSMLMIY